MTNPAHPEPPAELPSPAAATIELLRLALPMIGMTVSRMLMGFVDFLFVSTLGSAAQAAIYPSALLLFTIACVGMGLAQALQTFVSQADGRGEPHRAGPYLWNTLSLSVAAAALSAPIAVFTPTWFAWIGAAGAHPAEVQQLEIAFLSWALWSIGPMTACAGLESFYNGIRRPMFALVGMLAGLATIIVGNYALIFGHWGFPAMGIAGSGAATLAAWCVRLVVLLAPLAGRELGRRYGLFGGLRPRLERLSEILRIGGPIAFQWLVDIGAWLLFTEAFIPSFGTAAMAAAGIAIQYMHLSFMPPLGIGLALTTQVGNAVGARAPALVVLRVRVAQRLIVAYMCVMAGVFLAAGRPLAGLLCSEADAGLREEVLTAATAMLAWVALFQLPDALCIVYSFAARGAGDTRVPALLVAVCCWGIFAGGGWMMLRFAPQAGFHGPWAMCTLYIAVLGVLLVRRFRSRAWERIRVFSGDAQP